MRRRKLAFVLLALMLFVVAACNTKERATTTNISVEELAPTARFFKQNCAVCHGANGEGKQLGSTVVPSLKEGKVAADSDERIKEQIINGGNGMPPFGITLTDKQIQDLVRYIRDDIQKDQR